MLFNEEELRKALAIIKPNGQLYEVRIIYNNKKTKSGYFDNTDNFIECLKKEDLKDSNIYITLNVVNPACNARVQKDCFILNAGTTTSDTDILGYDWLFIDLDPKRPKDTSSTDDQLKAANDLAIKIYRFMRNLGFNDPIRAVSGNGIHLLYKVCLNNNKENIELMQKCTKTLDMLFTNNIIDIDKKTFNPSRVSKLYGTLAQKGKNVKDYPHRLSRILGNPQEIKVNDRKYLEKLCKLYPENPDKPSAYNNYNAREFDLDGWLSKYGLRYKKEERGDVDKYILECCPFDSSHKGKDACIFRSRSGAIGFNCFHNSCSDKTWRDVRILFEPDAYEKRRLDYDKQIYGSKNRDNPPQPKLKKESKPIVEKKGNPVFFTAMDIYNLPFEEESFIKTGITMIDKKLRGLKKGAVSVVSGYRASAKSTVLSEWALNAVNDGFNVGVYSGELTERNFMKWLNLQAAGKGYVTETDHQNYYVVKRQYQKTIAEWLGNRFWLYNNKYGNDFVAIKNEFEKVITEKKLDLLILDNLMCFELGTLKDYKYDAQSEFVLQLTDMAKQYNVHICFVAHPRKGQGFLRLDDISGTMDLVNAVDNAFLVHRNNHDFETRFQVEYSKRAYEDLGNATNVIEIAKDRDGGTQDVFVPLWYETESKRLKNDPAENKLYGWLDNISQIKKEPKKKEESKDIIEGEWVMPDINMETPFY